jgi:hypothetical protein
MTREQARRLFCHEFVENRIGGDDVVRRYVEPDFFQVLLG